MNAFRSFRSYLTWATLLIIVFAILTLVGRAQDRDPKYAAKSDPKVNRMRASLMLEDIQAILERKYYDRSFHGLDLKQKVKAAQDQIKQLDKNWQIMRVIAQLLIDLN